MKVDSPFIMNSGFGRNHRRSDNHDSGEGRRHGGSTSLGRIQEEAQQPREKERQRTDHHPQRGKKLDILT